MSDQEVINCCLNCTYAQCHPDICKKIRVVERAHRRHFEQLRRGTVYTVDGFSGTLTQWAKRLDISEGTIRTRMYKGMTFEEAIRYKKGQRSSKAAKRFEYEGKWLTPKEVSEMCGIGEKTVWTRLNVMGMTVEECIATPNIRGKSWHGRKREDANEPDKHG